jgi:hypothetical protein
MIRENVTDLRRIYVDDVRAPPPLDGGASYAGGKRSEVELAVLSRQLW